MAIKGIVFDNQTVTAKDHGRLFEKAFDDGVIAGCTLSIADSTLNIAAGYFICAGRLMKINSNEAIALSGSGYIRVKVVIDTAQTASTETFNQAVFVTENSDAIGNFPALVQNDVNGADTGTYEYAFCYLYYNEGWTVYRGIEKCLIHSDSIVINTQTTVSGWVANSSGAYYTAGYVYKKVVPVPGCTAAMTGDVIFNIASASTGYLAPTFDTGEDSITVYSKTNDTATIDRIEVHL